VPVPPAMVNVMEAIVFWVNFAPTYVPLVEELWTVTVIDAVGVELVSPLAERASWVGEIVRLAAGGRSYLRHRQ